MTTDREQELLDAATYTGSIIRCSIEPMGDKGSIDGGFNQVFLEIGQPTDQSGAQLRLAITTTMCTADLSLAEIQHFALEHAKKLVQHTASALKRN